MIVLWDRVIGAAIILGPVLVYVAVEMVRGICRWADSPTWTPEQRAANRQDRRMSRVADFDDWARQQAVELADWRHDCKVTGCSYQWDDVWDVALDDGGEGGS